MPMNQPGPSPAVGQAMAESVFGARPAQADAEVFVRADVEGDLVRLDQPAPHYAKRLPLQVAWHVDMLETLGEDLAAWVDRVEQRFTQDSLMIHYRADFQPLNGQALAAWFDGRPLPVWRLARLGLGLARALAALHEVGLGQMTLHPERVGFMAGRFAVLPTLAGVLEPLSTLVKRRDLGWLFYTAPEILRTRCGDPGLLAAADVFALGRLLAAATAGVWQPPVFNDAPEQIEALVERLNIMATAPSGSIPMELASLLTAMTAPMPEHRPGLGEVIANLEATLLDQGPESLLLNQVGVGTPEEMETLLSDLEQEPPGSPFALPPALLSRARAEIELRRQPPRFQEALGALNRSEKLEPNNAAIVIRIAQVYEQFKEHPSHLRLSAQAYQRAVALGELDSEVVASWLSVLERLGDPRYTLESTAFLPRQAWTAELAKTRAGALLVQSMFVSAWQELVDFFSRHGFDDQAYALARQVAEHLAPQQLMRSYHLQYKDTPGLEALAALAWERNGNLDLAQQWLDRARQS